MGGGEGGGVRSHFGSRQVPGPLPFGSEPGGSAIWAQAGRGWHRWLREAPRTVAPDFLRVLRGGHVLALMHGSRPML
eukprot:3862097-Pyramimonas_sp.AAC.1